MGAGSTGQVMLDGESRWTIAGDAHVGDAGHGVLELTTSPGLGDPVVEVEGALRIGVGGTGVGEVELFGAGSRVEATSFAVVGEGGEGHLTVGLADADTLLDASGQVACGSAGEGTVLVRDGAELRARKGASPSGSAGIFGLNDGAVGSALVQSEGHLNCVDGALVIGFRDGSSGALTVEDGGLVTSVGGFVGREAGGAGTVVVTGVGSVWNSGGALEVGVEGSGTVEVTAGGRIEAGVVSVGPNGVLAGDGSIEGDLENAGVVAPGPVAADATLGALMLEGGFSQSSTGRLVLEVGGTGPGQWDRLQGNFTGVFDLGGTLEIELFDGFVPAGGEVLIVLAGGFMANDFDSLVGPVPFTFAPGETVGIVTFCPPADLNCDGVVNGGDLGIQLSQWGGPGTGDLNHDGVVNGADVGLLLAAWSG